MISYDNFWETMSKRGVTKYSLIYHYGISSNTLRRMSHGESITTSTINELCMILRCEPKDILSFEITEEERLFNEKREIEVSAKKKKRVFGKECGCIIFCQSFGQYFSGAKERNIYRKRSLQRV